MSDKDRSSSRVRLRSAMLAGGAGDYSIEAGRRNIGKLEHYLAEAHKICRKVTREYQKRSFKPRAFPRSARDLHRIIKAIYNEEGRGTIIVDMLIENDDFKVEGVFRGFITRRKRGSGSRIVLNPFQKEDERRVALVQESFQALLDFEELKTEELAPAIEDFLRYRKTGKLETAKWSTFGELIAEVITMEALFPYKERVNFLAGLKGGKRTAAMIEGLEKTYGIPQHLIRCYTSKSTMEKLKKFHATAPKHSGKANPRSSRKR